MFRYLVVIIFFIPTILIGADRDACAVGIGVMDLLAYVDDDYFAQTIDGRKGGSYGVSPEKFEMILEELSDACKISPGGSAGNTIRALAKLDVPSGFLCHVGEDPMGKLFIQESSNLKISGIQIEPGLMTTRMLCLVTPDAERTFVHCHGKQSWALPSESYFDHCKWVHFEGYLLWDCPSALEPCLRAAKEAGAMISLDLANFALVTQHKETLQSLISSYVDVLFGNEEEYEILTGMQGESACKALAETVSIAVLTRGGNSCLIGEGREVTEVEGFFAKATDTTGAGDYFSAGFIYGCLNQFSPVDSALIGHLMGSSIVEHLGTDLPSEKCERIKALLRTFRKGQDLRYHLNIL